MADLNLNGKPNIKDLSGGTKFAFETKAGGVFYSDLNEAHNATPYRHLDDKRYVVANNALGYEVYIYTGNTSAANSNIASLQVVQDASAVFDSQQFVALEPFINENVEIILDSFGNNPTPTLFVPLIQNLGGSVFNDTNGQTSTNFRGSIAPGRTFTPGYETAEGDGITRQSMFAQISTALSRNPDVLIIGTFSNEFYYSVPIGAKTDTGTTTLYGALKSAAATIAGYTTKALKVYFITLTPRNTTTKGGSVSGRANLGIQLAIEAAVNDVCADYGFNVINMMKGLFTFENSAAWTQDGAHLKTGVPSQEYIRKLRAGFINPIVPAIVPTVVNNITNNYNNSGGGSSSIGDNFNRADNQTTLIGTNSLNWITPNGVFGISGNKAANFDSINSTFDHRIAVVPGGSSNGTMTATVIMSATRTFARIYFRYVDVNNYLMMQFVSDQANVEVYSLVNGNNNYVKLGNAGSVPALGATIIYKAVCNGTSVEIFANNQSIFSASNVTANQTGNNYGIGISKGGGPTQSDAGDTYFDDFSFTV